MQQLRVLVYEHERQPSEGMRYVQALRGQGFAASLRNADLFAGPRDCERCHAAVHVTDAPAAASRIVSAYSDADTPCGLAPAKFSRQRVRDIINALREPDPPDEGSQEPPAGGGQEGSNEDRNAGQEGHP